jgi:L-fuconolactonase
MSQDSSSSTIELVENFKILFPVIDPHHHLYERISTTGKVGVEAGDEYLCKELINDAKGVVPRLVATVYAEAKSFYDFNAPKHLQSVGESARVQEEFEKLQDLKRKKKEMDGSSQEEEICLIGQGIVCFIDLTGDEKEIEEAIKEHLRVAKNVRGVRYNLAWDEDKGFLQAVKDPHISKAEAFRKGLKLLEKYNLSFDAFFYHPQLGDLLEIAQAFPNLKIILDHTGCPLRVRKYAESLDAVEANWRHGIEQLSKCPNVFLKVRDYLLLFLDSSK